MSAELSWSERAESSENHARLTLVAPVDGVLTPLADVPDEVFAQRLMGDGFAIDPTSGVLVAPCAGTISQLHRAHHALTIKTSGGAALLLHVGVNTVQLAGTGFRPLVREGETVTAGQSLLEFDLDLIAQKATSALTLLIVTEGGGDLRVRRKGGLVRAGVDELGAVTLGSVPPTSAVRSESLRSTPIAIVNPNGLHARPAARLAAAVKQFDAHVVIRHGERSAPANSVSDLMALDLQAGDEVLLAASGRDAERAIAELSALIRAGLGESLSHAKAKPTENARAQAEEPGVTSGVAAAPGIAIGAVTRQQRVLPHFDATTGDPAAATKELKGALARARGALASEHARFQRAAEHDKAQIFAAHAELLDDPALIEEAERRISEGASAPAAWVNTYSAKAERLRGSRGAVMRQRAADLEDVGDRVLYALLGIVPPAAAYAPNTVLVSDELSPSAVATLDTAAITGLITREGGASSHAAIIARAMGIPYVAGLGIHAETLANGSIVIVDGSSGQVTLAPSAQAIARAEQEREARRRAGARAAEQSQGAARTADGRVVEVAANIGNLTDARDAVARGADGVGLLRSEFLFLNRRSAPSEQEQSAALIDIAKTLGRERPLVIRTLDVGGDKPLSYLPLPAEDNPFLGIRGLRLSLRHKALFVAQLRALLATAELAKLHVMFPMLATLEELLAAKALLAKTAFELGVDTSRVKVGVMIEVPSAALMADVLAPHVDFFSIGTNDLTQYTLAMDRGHPELAREADQLDPSVLRLINMTVTAAQKQGRWVGVCGGLAAEALAVPLLVGLGIGELSVPPPSVPEVKARVRTLRYETCREIAQQALALPSARAVRALLANVPTEPNHQEIER